MKYRLETIPNIGTVNVTREGPTNEMRFSSTITFTSNVDTFLRGARNIDFFEVSNSLETTIPGDNSAMISVLTANDGDEPLTGKFQM